MPDARWVAFTCVTLTVACGTAYSILYGTYLDTSNPLVAHLAHPLHKTHYWARKSNFLNVYFIKKAWGWTSAAFWLLWMTGSSSKRTFSRVLQWLTATFCWFIFTASFFGPPLLDRVIAASGGECIVVLPSGEPISVPAEYCYTRTTISPASHPEIITSSLLPSEWTGVPRLRKGHDVSGHIFLLTMSVLFIADQLRPSLRLRDWSAFHKWAMVNATAMIGVWCFSAYTTSLYFHSPFEKVTGYLLGVAGFAMTQLIPVVFRTKAQQPRANCTQ
ncbi:hypothetical protein D9758_001954 [Tetrapyrgos nigripes]|uniref:Uncharacterized protein n=1 Tax=Tetrapyrgos nigripes TaxID=182062 RepID=A0A8H5GT89_9AGAR|nr:hypothetical protein D9758_001954 [Tetrapyrgos nigripes]